MSENVKGQSGFAHSALHILLSSSSGCDDTAKISETYNATVKDQQKETVVLRRRASETLSYQREVDKGKLTAVASFEMLTFRARALPVPLCSDEGLWLETSAFQNSPRRLIYPYQLHVDN